AWGLQVHPEASPETVGRWARQTPGVDADAVEAELVAVDDEVSTSGRLIAEAFVAVVLAGELTDARTAP
ncbi:MAG: type 1 glutamine amidotransferase, partial [Cellulomonas sp.]